MKQCLFYKGKLIILNKKHSDQIIFKKYNKKMLNKVNFKVKS